MEGTYNGEGAPHQDAPPSSAAQEVENGSIVPAARQGVNSAAANFSTGVTSLGQDAAPAGMAMQRRLWIATGKGNLGVIRQQGELTWAEFCARQRNTTV